MEIGENLMESAVRRTLLVAVTLVLVQVTSASPATAHDVGPAFFCDPQTFNNCTDTSDPASAEDAFSCQGTAGNSASCTNQRTGESSPYCVCMGEEGTKNRDAYLCGPQPGFSDNQLVDNFWQHLEAAQQEVGFP